MARATRRSTARAAATAERQQPVRTATFVITMGLALICIAGIVVLVVANTPTDKFGPWPRLFVIALLAIFTIASLASTEIIPWRSRNWRDWRRPKVLGTVVYLLLSAVGFVVGIATIFNPPAADEEGQRQIGRDLQVIGKTTQEILGAQRKAATSAGSAIDAVLQDYWGEPGCKVTYRFTHKEGWLSIARSKKRSTTPPREWLFTIEPKPDKPTFGAMRTSTASAIEQQGFRPGQAVTFDYRTDGRSHFLDWRGASPDQPMPTLVRCPKED